MSTGATAEELAVFQASSTVDAQGILADMKKRRDSQLRMYLDYKSSEAARLDDAVLYVHDTFVVYMVSNVDRRTFLWIRFLRLPQKKLLYR